MKHGCLIFILSFAAFFAATVWFSLINRESIGIPTSADIKYVRIAEQDIKVELALSKEAQTRGLSGRDGLAEGEGMLFVYSRPGRYSFWMKDMKFPIDIIWIGEDMRVVYIKESAEPASYPDVFVSGADAKYILEVNAGFSEKNSLKVGDGALFTY